MILQIYKPNKSNTGHAMSINVNRNFKCNRNSPKYGEPQLFVSVLKQSSWDTATSTGSFEGSRGDETKEVFVKFNEFEVGQIASSLSRGNEISLFHTSGDNKTQISFKRNINEYQGKKSIRVAFGITKNSNLKFFMPIDEAEIKTVIACLEEFLSTLYKHRISQSFKRQVENSHKKQEENRNNS